MPMDSREHTLGFSLIELMAVLVIISIAALTSAGPIIKGFHRMKERSNLNSTARAFIQAVHFARYQAQSRQEFITISPICENRWDSGWRVFIHPRLDFQEPSQVNTLLRYTPPTGITSNPEMNHPSNHYSGNGFEDVSVKNNQMGCSKHGNQIIAKTSEKLKHISFNPAGGAQMKNGGLIANRLIFWSQQFPDMQQQIIMGAGGRLRICTPSVENSQCRQ